MIRKALLVLFITSSLFTSSLYCQKTGPHQISRFADITAIEKEFTVGNVAARMVEGLGFRYYWATQGLKKEDLNYRPSESGRTTFETIQHIHGLSEFMLLFLRESSVEVSDLDDSEKVRSATLLNLERIEKKLTAMSAEDFENYRAGEVTFWQFINGPVSDAIWHSGQVVMMRRASGNPIAEGVNVLMGKKR